MRTNRLTDHSGKYALLDQRDMIVCCMCSLAAFYLDLDKGDALCRRCCHRNEEAKLRR